MNRVRDENVVLQDALRQGTTFLAKVEVRPEDVVPLSADRPRLGSYGEGTSRQMALGTGAGSFRRRRGRAIRPICGVLPLPVAQLLIVLTKTFFLAHYKNSREIGGDEFSVVIEDRLDR